jgi:hypothetical protein
VNFFGGSFHFNPNTVTSTALAVTLTSAGPDGSYTQANDNIFVTIYVSDILAMLAPRFSGC